MSIPRASCDRTMKSPPSFSTAGFPPVGPGALHHLGDDAADTCAGQADGAGCARRQVKHAAVDEGATVVDGNDHAAVTMGDLELGAERQGPVGSGHGVLVEALTGGGLAAGLIAIIGGH